MFSLLRNRFGIPGVIAVIALVFAMLGGAYAASGGLNAKQKKEVKTIAKSFQGTGPAGPPGSPGPAGPAGPVGPKGDKGDLGSNGPVGATGKKGATGKAGTAGAAGKAGATGPSGLTGAPWPAGGTLPKNATETGSWFGTVPAAGEGVVAAISFAIPLKEGLEVQHAHVVTITGKELNDEFTALIPAVHCLGSAPNPIAKPGELCVYMAQASSGELIVIPEKSGVTPAAFGASTTGAVLNFTETSTAGEEVRGTFAVTGS